MCEPRACGYAGVVERIAKLSSNVAWDWSAVRVAEELKQEAEHARAQWRKTKADFNAALAEVRTLPEPSEWAKDAVSRMRYGRLRATEPLTTEQYNDIAAAALVAAAEGGESNG